VVVVETFVPELRVLEELAAAETLFMELPLVMEKQILEVVAVVEETLQAVLLVLEVQV
jgi:hypothetical protein